MKIKDIRVEKVDLALTRPYTIAFKTVSEVAVIYVEIEADNGLIGYGAANPSPQVVGETLEDSLEALKPEQLEWLSGQDVRSLPALGELLFEKMTGRPGARAALDIALHDLHAKYLGLPLVDYFGRRHQALPTSITIGIKGVEETLDEAREYQERGFKILKVKTGQDVEEDIARIRKLRETLGSGMGIRVDANQGYDQKDVFRFFEATHHWDIELIEQPLPADDLAGTHDLPPEIRQKLAADESLLIAEDAWPLTCPNRAVGIFNIKLMKCGGIYQARRIAEMARIAELQLMWGCNDESVISIAAALHLALACPHTRYLDLDGSLDLGRDLAQGGFTLRDGLLDVAPGPGLGITPLKF